jgi:hypothetical protein
MFQLDRVASGKDDSSSDVQLISSKTRDGILGHEFDKTTKDSSFSSLLLHAIFSHYLLQADFTEKPHKKSAKQEISSLFKNSIL